MQLYCIWKYHIRMGFYGINLCGSGLRMGPCMTLILNQNLGDAGHLGSKAEGEAESGREV